mgnify:CR=1 FL=1
MLFPHLYGILPVEAVEEVFSLERNPEGRWILPEYKRIPEMPMFSEIPYGTPGHAFRSRMPGSSMFDAGDEIFSKYLDNSVHTVIVLNPVEEIIKYSGGDLLARYHDAGLRVIHIPARDFNVPQIGAFDRGVELAARLLKEGKNIAIHCHALAARACSRPASRKTCSGSTRTPPSTGSGRSSPTRWKPASKSSMYAPSNRTARLPSRRNKLHSSIKGLGSDLFYIPLALRYCQRNKAKKLAAAATANAAENPRLLGSSASATPSLHARKRRFSRIN